eukprot:gb/GEZN01015519.1/.p1 GENE.gb/GEZN01015519.1/~~gb/GEZN01015519.1/.p1  ORF type:complete len:288 (+),score=47.04 gb/GEZN01015519.1/:70-864(+)
MEQVHFQGTADCQAFLPHRMKPDMCISCMKKLHAHSKASIKDDEQVLSALEYSTKGQTKPSCVLPHSSTMGGLYIGGWITLLHLHKYPDITHIVNTAKGLEMFGPKYVNAVKTLEKKLQGTETASDPFLRLNWVDDAGQDIAADLPRIVAFIHQARKQGGSVLVHCAQGKSRSSTALLLYLLAAEPNPQSNTLDDALAFLKSKRKMAEPNPGFMKKLRAVEQSEDLKKIKSALKLQEQKSKGRTEQPSQTKQSQTVDETSPSTT